MVNSNKKLKAIEYFKIKYKDKIISEKYGSEYEFIIK